VLIWSEQGLGDSIQFCRYIYKIIDLGAKITFDISKKLTALMSRQFNCTINETGQGLVQNDFDFQIIKSNTLNLLHEFNELSSFLSFHVPGNIIIYDDLFNIDAGKEHEFMMVEKVFLGNTRNILYTKLTFAEVNSNADGFYITSKIGMITHINSHRSMMLSCFTLTNHGETIHLGSGFVIPSLNDEGHFNFIFNILLPIANIHLSGLNSIPIIAPKIFCDRLIQIFPDLNLYPLVTGLQFKVDKLYTFFEDGRRITSDMFTILSDIVPLLPDFKFENERIYISRKKARNRVLTNEDQLIEGLRKLNFSIINLEDLDLAQQFKIFETAKIIVAPHGAGLSNIVFCKNCTVLVELASKNYHILGFKNLCIQKEIAYEVIFGGDLIENSWEIDVEVVFSRMRLLIV
jgi:hypothetical protein